MKNSIYSLVVLFGLLGSCASQKKVMDSAPFNIDAAFCQEFVGGREESGSGLLLKIPVDSLEDYTLQKAYFRKKVATVSLSQENGKQYAVALFLKNKTGKPDINMHADGREEVGNQPPKLKDADELSFPFELNENEAILSFLKGKKVKYVKVSPIKDKQAMLYPSKPKN